MIADFAGNNALHHEHKTTNMKKNTYKLYMVLVLVVGLSIGLSYAYLYVLFTQ